MFNIKANCAKKSENRNVIQFQIWGRLNWTVTDNFRRWSKYSGYQLWSATERWSDWGTIQVLPCSFILTWQVCWLCWFLWFLLFWQIGRLCALFLLYFVQCWTMQATCFCCCCFICMFICLRVGERFIEKKENKLTNVSFALTPTYVQ